MEIEAKVYNATNSSQSKSAKKLIDRIKCENPNEKYDIILDIGCGTGNVTQMLTELLDVNQVFGLDVQENLINFAKNNNHKENITYLIQDIGLDWDKLSPEIRSLKGRVSLIFSSICLHWIKERENLGINIRNLLSNNGKFYATVFCFPDLYNNLTPDEKSTIEQDFIKIPTEGEQLEAWRNTFQLYETRKNSTKIYQVTETVETKILESYGNAMVTVFSIYFTRIANLSDKEKLDDLIRRNINMNCKKFIDQNTGKEMIDMWYNYFEFGLTNTKNN